MSLPLKRFHRSPSLHSTGLKPGVNESALSDFLGKTGSFDRIFSYSSHDVSMRNLSTFCQSKIRTLPQYSNKVATRRVKCRWTRAVAIKSLGLRKVYSMPNRNSRHAKWVVVLLPLLGFSSGWWRHSFEKNPPDVRAYVQKARAAYKEKNYSMLIENMKSALELRPNYGPFTYNVAAGYALSGN